MIIDPETDEVLFNNEAAFQLFQSVGSNQIDAKLPFLSFNEVEDFPISL